ncbi:MAG: histidinol-phosphatase (PHP family) [Candidatus Azotimanducaceae bacterium]
MEALKVSVHGGHSGQFCNHAEDSLEEIVLAYIAAGFTWFGVTEHMPAVTEQFVYPDERDAGLSADKLQRRFHDYFTECIRLKQKYKTQVELLVGFEIESCTGSVAFVDHIIERYKPDYIVGSVHHVSDMMIDFSAEEYEKAVQYHGGIEQLYCAYFDQQLEMIERFEPSVIGHFDLIRIFDRAYMKTMDHPGVAERITRNLEAIKSHDLILDFNMAGFDKPGGEPYPHQSILHTAKSMGISLVPGDDSHGVKMVGRHYDEGLARLAEAGVSPNFRKPRLLQGQAS